MLSKKKVLQPIESLPETFSFDELVDRIALLEKIQNGIKQSEMGDVFSTDAAKEKSKKWL